MTKFKDFLENNVVIFDGAMGTEILKKTEIENSKVHEVSIKQPEIISDIHNFYMQSGSDVICSNTFSLSYLLANDKKADISNYIETSMHLAYEAREAFSKNSPKNVFIAYDAGPTGRISNSENALSYEEIYKIYKTQFDIARKNHADIILLETAIDIYELKCAVLCAKENTSLPIIATMTFDGNARTASGTDIQTFANIIAPLGVDAIGVNCCGNIEEITPHTLELLSHTNVPVLIQPNAISKYSEKPGMCMDTNDFASHIKQLVTKGVRLIGGCCGTTAEHIAALRKIIPEKEVNLLPKNELPTRISSSNMTVDISKSPIIAGNRINTLENQSIMDALSNQDYNYIVGEAVKQYEEGAKLVNLCFNNNQDIHEAEVFKKIIPMIEKQCPVPLMFETKDLEALKEAMKVYKGRPVINYVLASKSSLQHMLPIAKKYGAVLVALTLDEKFTPDSAYHRVQKAMRVVQSATDYGMEKEDLIIDPLVMPTYRHNTRIVTDAIKNLHYQGFTTMCKINNISQDLPNRDILDNSFVNIALGYGLDIILADPSKDYIKEAIWSINLFMGKDKDAEEYKKNISNIKK